ANGYDCLFVVGSSLGELATTKTVPTVWDQKLLPAGPFIQVDANQAAVGRAFPVDLGIIADAGATLDELFAAAADKPVPSSAADRAAFVAELKQTPPNPPVPPTPTPGTVHPAALMNVLNAALPAGAHVFIDAG